MKYKSRDMGKAVDIRRWTPTAKDCYARGCVCEGCFYSDFFESKNPICKMKAAVLELVRMIGIPEGVESKGVIE